MTQNSSLHNTPVDTAGNLKPTLSFGKLALGIAVLLLGTTTILTLIFKPTDEGSTSSSTAEQSYHWSFENPASKEVFQVLKGSWESVQKKGVNGSSCMLSSRGSSEIKINIPLAGKAIHLSFQTKFYRKGKNEPRTPTLGLLVGILIQDPEVTPSQTRWNQFDIYVNEKSALVKINGETFLYSLLRPNKSKELLLVTFGMWLLDDLHIEALSPEDKLQFDPYLDFVHEHLSDLSPTPTRFDIQVYDKKSSIYAFMPKPFEVVEIEFSD